MKWYITGVHRPMPAYYGDTAGNLRGIVTKQCAGPVFAMQGSKEANLWCNADMMQSKKAVTGFMMAIQKSYELVESLQYACSC
jgi:hypothetical protein